MIVFVVVVIIMFSIIFKAISKLYSDSNEMTSLLYFVYYGSWNNCFMKVDEAPQ